MTNSPDEPDRASDGDDGQNPAQAGSSVDLNATVTLSGEALAALLEQVKNARASSTIEPPSGDSPSDKSTPKR